MFLCLDLFKIITLFLYFKIIILFLNIRFFNIPILLISAGFIFIRVNSFISVRDNYITNNKKSYFQAIESNYLFPNGDLSMAR